MGFNKASGARVLAGRVVTEGGFAPYAKVIKLVAPGTTVETDTGYDLPAKAIVADAVLVVTAAASAGSVVDVGLLSSESGGDADGFLDGVSSTGVAMRTGVPTATSSAGFSTTTRGALLRTFFAGVESSSPGVHNVKDHLSDSVTAKSVSFTINGTSTTFRGDLILHIIETGAA